MILSILIGKNLNNQIEYSYEVPRSVAYLSYGGFQDRDNTSFFIPMRYRDCDAKSFPIDQETGMLRYRLQR